MAVSFAPPRWWQRRFGLLIVLLMLVYMALNWGARLAVEVLWYQELGYLPVFKTRIASQVLLGLAGFLVAFAALASTLLAALRRSPLLRLGPRGDLDLSLIRLEHRAPHLALVVAAFAALLFGTSLASHWLTMLVFLKRLPFGVSEPIFGHDVGFYVLALPALRQLAAWLLGLAVVALLGTLGLYGLRGGLVGSRPMQTAALRHVGLLGVVVLVLLAVQAGLAQYEVLLSAEGAVFGAGYTDVHTRLPGMRMLVVACLLAAAAVAYGAARDRRGWLLVAPGLLLGLYILATAVVPSAVQKLVVEPNESVKEKPYIENAVRLTRQAYDLESIEEQPFQLQPLLQPQSLQANRTLVDNIRLWDWRPLLSTYAQIQEIRPYYNFGDVDIDRYTLDGQYRQVMLSARELAAEKIPEGARTWVNLHLKYTHGYGLCMSPVNRITKEGLPDLLIRDIPPVSLVDLKVTRPEIYYGEQTTPFALVRTNTEEFDYPVGETNRTTRYAGQGGIGVGTPWHRLLFAWHLRSRELLLTAYLTPESRILMRRALPERAPRVAPFLRYDSDPYLVVNDGRMVWVQDAYTVSSRFPYSRPTGAINYIRNAVKVVVDAYDGTTRFYVADPRDPLLRVYAAIFPGLFLPLDAMPPGLRQHLRYPEDMFTVQARTYATYHMQDPQVFYNREDLWDLPVGGHAGQEVRLDPYYAMLRLPGQEREELVLMLPFTPARKDNMIAWMAARCDGADLGKRVVFVLPKQALVYGPRQIEARIDQDPVISQQLTLWSQRGSSIIRGNMLVIPIAQSILYVESLYLQAEKGALPELKRVILAQADRIVMGTDLESTLGMLMGTPLEAAATEGATPTPTGAAGPAPAAAGAVATPGVRRALEIMRGAQAALQRGDWEAYGREMQRLQRELETQAGATPTPPR